MKNSIQQSVIFPESLTTNLTVPIIIMRGSKSQISIRYYSPNDTRYIAWLKVLKVVPKSQFTPEMREYFTEEQEVSDTNYNLTPTSDMEPGVLENFKGVAEAVIGEVGKYVARPFFVWRDCSCDNSCYGTEDLRS
jgi:hypothetical protein